MKKPEEILSKLGLNHGDILKCYDGRLFDVYYTRTKVFGYDLWCYVQIWCDHLPDIWLSVYSLHTMYSNMPSRGSFMPSRDSLYHYSIYRWTNYGGESYTLTEEFFTELMIKSVCE